jgi:sporulation protein YlmC with PRC-barrel domain/DNA-directed RNA polymerase subunit RPC12/RpoP
MMNGDNELRAKKLRGSGGFAYAKVTDEEQKRGNLGGPELFLAGIGRLDDDRFSKYYCNNCEKDYDGSPGISYTNPNEELGQGVKLIEKGEYRCRSCDSVLAQYRRFDTPPSVPEGGKDSTSKIEHSEATAVKNESPSADLLHSSDNSEANIPNTNISAPYLTDKANAPTTESGFIPIQSLIGMPAYNSEAMLVGRVQEIGLRKSHEGKVQISVKISHLSNDSGRSESGTENTKTEVLWNGISKLGDILLLSTTSTNAATSNLTTPSINESVKCTSCGSQNEEGAIFCEECGSKLG